MKQKTIMQNTLENKSFLSLGTNIGDKEENLRNAIKEIKSFSKILKKSSTYITSPVGYIDQDDFFNMVVEISTNLSAQNLLESCKQVEAKMGRIKKIHNGPRIIDIDILFFKYKIINEENLIIPHPRIEKRLFVLEPLNEISPNLVHPVIKLDIKTLLSKLRPVSDELVKKLN